MFAQQPPTALNTTTPATTNAQPAIPAGQTGQTGTQPSLFSGFGQQQQSQPTQSFFGNPAQNQQQQPGQPPANQSGGAPSLFGSSTLNAPQPPSTFGGASWNTGNPLLPKSAFGAGMPAGQAQNGGGLGTSLFGQQPPPPQQNTGFGNSFLAPTQNQIQQTWAACFFNFLSLTTDSS
jgi:hypothetical protein